MTVEVEKPTDFLAPPEKESDKNVAALEDLFLLGYTSSPVYTIYKDDKGIEISVQFRSLTPCEIRDISEAVGRFGTSLAQFLTEEMETLARAIKYVNGMPLVLDSNERERYFKEHKKQASPLEMARIVLQEKIKSQHILDAMFEAYQEFIKSIQENFEDVKKKLKDLPSSNSTS